MTITPIHIDPSTSLISRFRRVMPLLVLGAVALVWLTTLQTQISLALNDPSPDFLGPVWPLVADFGPVMDDSGEFVVAWNTWGVTHPPGYPLLNLVANVLTHGLRLVKVAPVTAASLVSWLFGVGALFFAGLLAQGENGSGIEAAAAVLPAAFGAMTWLFASVAESYSLGLLLGFASLFLALEIGAHPNRRTALLLGLFFGLAIGHHRTLLALSPALVWAAWPARRLGWATWLGAAGLAVLSLLVYAYLPLTAALGSPWVYGRSPATWEGFLDAILAREYSAQLAPPLTLQAIWSALVGRVRFVAWEMTPAGLALGLVGLVAALTTPSTRRPAIAMGLVLGGYLLAPVGQYLLLGTHMPIMVAALALAVAWGLGLTALSARRPVVESLSLLLTLGAAAAAFMAHGPSVRAYTKEQAGRQLLDAVATLDAAHPTVVETWGPRYSALAYGQLVTGELAHIRLIDARANLSGLPPVESLPSVLYTTAYFLYQAGPDAWSEWAGREVALESAGDGIAAIYLAPGNEAEEDDAGQVTFPIVLDSAQAWLDGGDVRLTLVWRAMARPTEDYHVFVHLAQHEPIRGPEDILAQGDRQHPVYGFYPTSRWQAGEGVRDDYRVPIPRGGKPTIAVVGLYSVTEDGVFVNHLSQIIPITGE